MPTIAREETDRLYTRNACSDHLASWHSRETTGTTDAPPPTSAADEEIIIDSKLVRRNIRELKKSSIGGVSRKRDNNQDNAAVTSHMTLAAALAADSPPLDSSVRGYKCAIDNCHKIFMVSSIQGPSVAISRLKNHFNIKHQSLGSDSFAFEAIYSPVASPADYRDGSPDRSAGPPAPAIKKTPARKSPARASAAAAAVVKSPSAGASPGDQELSRNKTQRWF